MSEITCSFMTRVPNAHFEGNYLALSCAGGVVAAVYTDDEYNRCTPEEFGRLLERRINNAIRTLARESAGTSE